MYFNLDREKKQRILDYYKNEALASRLKKQEAKKLKIQEELDYLHQKEEEELETEKKIFQEQSKTKKILMEEYLKMLQKTHKDIPGFHFFPKNKDVIINNWGKTKEEALLENNNIYNNDKTLHNISLDNVNDNFNSLTLEEKEKEIIKPIDSMYNFLTDEPNQKEVNLFFLRRKNHKRDFYRNLLFSQHEKSNQINKNRYGTEDILILKQRKRDVISENPYRKKYKYSVGNSTLENNPILNPENNMRYNKYFREFYPDNIKQENNMTNGTENNKIYKNKNNFTIEQTHNNMAINGNNIMKSFDNSSTLNKNNREKLYRNFSGILKKDSSQDKNNVNIGINNYEENNNLNKALTNRCMSQKYFK